MGDVNVSNVRERWIVAEKERITTHSLLMVVV
jgi:hypothetical protein